MEVTEKRTSQPLPMLHPTTPHALPFARISSGKISAGYSHGTVNQVAPKMAVNRKTKKVAAIPAPTQILKSALLPLRKDRHRKHESGEQVLPCDSNLAVKGSLWKEHEPVLVEEPATAFCPTRERPPTRKMQIPMPMDPQYRVQRRPIRSSVKTQTRVES